MGYLEVDGATLYYECVGSGPVLLCISGADGTADSWRNFAHVVKEHFTVVMWDRRGFSRSYLVGSQDYECKLDTDADDAAKMIEHFSSDEAVTVIGSSAGAIVALRLLMRHPQKLRTLIPYEPPAYRILPDHEELHAAQLAIYDLYRRHGVYPALESFLELTKSESRGMASKLFDPRRSPFTSSNIQYWFEREFLCYPPTEFDIDRDFRPYANKLLLINGERTDRSAQQCRTNALIAEQLGLQVVAMPGEHLGHLTDAPAFGQALVKAVESRQV